MNIHKPNKIPTNLIVRIKLDSKAEARNTKYLHQEFFEDYSEFLDSYNLDYEVVEDI